MLLPPDQVLSRFPIEELSVWSMLLSRAETLPESEFIVFRGVSYTYMEAARLSDDLANTFVSRGVRPGDRVGVFARNHVTTLLSFLALAKLGAIFCPINPDFTVTEASYVLSHAQVCGLIYSPMNEQVAREAVDSAGLQPWLLCNDDIPIIAPAQSAAQDNQLSTGEDLKNHTCAIIYTSGTTGLPKGVMHSHKGAMLAAEGFVGRMWLQPDDRLLCIMPLFHLNALFYSFGGSLAAGATLILEEGFSASTFWRTVFESRATEVNFVAAIPAILQKRPRSEFVSGHSLVKACVAPLTEDTNRLLKEEFGLRTLLDGYGMTEIPGVTINPFNGPQKLGTCGIPCVHPLRSDHFAEIKIVDESGRERAHGKSGEILVRTPAIMQGYYRDAAQTRAAFSGDWFRTGDMGEFDEDGYLRFLGRQRDIIRRGGENISGAELDHAISAHPGVAAAAAIAVPDRSGEDEILVVVVLKPGVQLSAPELVDWCRNRLTRVKIPRYVVFSAELPYTPTHKVAKQKIRDDPGLMARAIEVIVPRVSPTT